MIRVRTAKDEGSYEVQFVSIKDMIALITQGDVVITDTNLASIYANELDGIAQLVVFQAGEVSKSFPVFESIVDRVVAKGLKRNGRIIGFGGGVVGDMAGFVAATVHRGVDFVQMPTTLLAMVDSSVGGKVGIDLRHGKNLLGAFKNPQSVMLSLETLKTLPEVQFVNGMAEVIKYGWIWDVELLDRLGRSLLTVNSGDLESVIRRCIEIKRDVVEGDFEEKSGLRAILNFGHTVGHALETLEGYDGLLHGEAISIGMVAETAIAKGSGLSDLEPGDVAEVLKMYGLPIRPKGDFDLDRLVDLMMADKKNIGVGLSMSLVKVPGECKLEHGIDPHQVKSILADLWN